jgi:hypothetical protein
LPLSLQIWVNNNVFIGLPLNNRDVIQCIRYIVCENVNLHEFIQGIYINMSTLFKTQHKWTPGEITNNITNVKVHVLMTLWNISHNVNIFVFFSEPNCLMEELIISISTAYLYWRYSERAINLTSCLQNWPERSIFNLCKSKFLTLSWKDNIPF